MYENRQYKRRNYYIQRKRYRFYIKTLIIFLCSLASLYPLIHLIQTGIFLKGHFYESEDTNDLIQLDIYVWQKIKRLKEKIPRYIHQIWISSIDDKSMPESFRNAANSCIQYHPNYNYTLWTHSDLRNWLKIEYPWFVSTYENYRYDMQRIDAMKYFLLFHFGGIYIDLDIQCNAQDILTAMIPKNQTEYEPDIIFHMGSEGISANTDIMAAKRLHPFFKLALTRLKSSNRWFYLYHLTIILSAGPTFLYGIYRKYPLKESVYFIPNHLLYGKLVEGVGGGTWLGKDSFVLFFFMKYSVFFSVLLSFLTLVLLFLFKLLRRK